MPRTLLFALFFASGACALVYEVVWIRLLSLTLSVTVYALTTVLCAFMSGLGLGTAIAAGLADRSRRPLLVFGLAEIGIAASGVLVPEILYRLPPAYVGLHQAFGGDGFLFHASRFLLAFGVLLAPSTLMGITFPFLSRVVISRHEAVGIGAGALYAANTLGAVVGCVVAGFVLIPALGLRLTSAGAATLNLAIGATAAAFGLRHVLPAAAAAARARGAPAPAGLRLPPGALLASAAFGVSGFTAMGYEVLWTRALEPFAHNSTYAYTAMLAMFLLGLGAGSAVMARLSDRLGRPLAWLGGVELAIAVAVTLALFLYARFETLIPAASAALGGLGSWPRVVALIFSEAAVTLAATTFLFGATFPLVARAAVESVSVVGSRIGVAYAANTVGAIVGSLVVGFALIPALGVRGSFVAMIAVNAALGALLLGASGTRLALPGVAAALLVGAGALGVVPQRLFVQSFEDRYGRLLFYREEVTDTVMVTEDERGHRMIRYGDGRGTAGTVSVAEDRMYAHIPLMLHEDPRRVLQIGFGVGNTLASVVRHPVERVVCVELSPGVIEAAPYFDSTNRDVLSDPRVELVIGDGRNHLLAVDARYDVIRLDPPELHTRGVVNLYTREFYESARSHLRGGGVFSIWVNVVMTPLDDLRMLVRTVQSVFPEVSIWRGPARYSWVINGSVEPLPPDLKRLVERFAMPRVRDDLAEIGVGGPFEFLDHFVLGGEDVRAFAGDGPLVVDDHTVLDFSVPRSRDSFYGIANANTANWLVDLMDPEGRRNAAVLGFLTKIHEMSRYRSSVVPHLVNVDTAGLPRATVAAGLEQLGG